MKATKSSLNILIILAIVFFATNLFAQGQMQFKSPAFSQLTTIPSQYTCDGEDISIPLEWGNLPAKAKSVAIVCLDPDAPKPFTHWVLYNIPADWNKLSENFTMEQAKQRGVVVGKNSWDKLGYGGPCPPKDEHRYYFQLFVLNDMLPAKEGLTKDELMYAMRMNVMAKKVYIGKYKKQ
ncbi:MAG: YbhB/YbcL family Raf kinase inhibitor-like protein [Bacteroidia bacterium]|nr:YbhB/YbcL family Raf kinase inhibitor-like protein [Bacteroidia bacterium]